MSTSVRDLGSARNAVGRERRERVNRGRGTGILELLRRTGRYLAAAHRRRAAIADLSRLDDRQLDDIGVRREQIPEVVDGVVDRTAGRGL